MRALIISDIHGNIDALHALEAHWGARFAEFDRIICLGDLVDYGADPGAVVDWVQAHATDVVRGNHDNAVGTGAFCRSSPAFLEASILTRLRQQSIFTDTQLSYLRSLPMEASLDASEPGDVGPVHLVHASPSDPLFGYMPPQVSESTWRAAFASCNAPTILIGHTHVAFVRRTGTQLVINPGSLGMPKDGNPHGSYAVLDGSSVQFCRVAYDPEPMIARLRVLDLPSHVFELLASSFRTGN